MCSSDLDYSTRDVYTRNLGWQTAVSPSVQYQVFSFTNNITTNTTQTFRCDIPPSAESSTNWPLVQVYINNVYQPTTNYTYSTDNATYTKVQINSDIVLENGAIIQVLLISDQTSNYAYYQIPTNLNNNPLNENLTTLNVGDIRGQ